MIGNLPGVPFRKVHMALAILKGAAPGTSDPRQAPLQHLPTFRFPRRKISSHSLEWRMGSDALAIEIKPHQPGGG